MKKEKILSKLNLNMKDYNIELEEILDKKAFNVEVQNLLLSMFYKIENFYSDYKQVKRQVPNRDEFIQELIKTISNNCKEIEVIKPKGIKKQEKYSVNSSKGIIETFPNELILIYALYKIDQIKSIEEKALINNAVIDVLNEGRTLNCSELVRDFNGWSWTTMLDKLDSIQYNLVFQNLLLLLGYEKISYISKLSDKNQIALNLQKEIESKYGEENGNEFSRLFFSICILLKSSMDEKYKKEVLNEKKKLTDKLEMLQDKARFLSRITNDKKELTNKIKEIDKILNNVDLLKEEYKKRNKKLSKDEQIFSISNFVDIIESERMEFIQDIKEYNDLIDPRKFGDMKKQIEQKQVFFNKLDLFENKKEPINQYILDIQKQFLKCFKIQVEKCALKKDMIDLIYEYRYYRFLKYNKEKNIKENRYLNKLNQDIIDSIIKKAEELKVLENISSNKEYNKIVLEEIFNTRIITLENISVQIIQEDGKMLVQYFDGNILESKKEIQIKDNSIKLRKKIKLFV